ncbi:MAG: sigma-70 family RNA polymerase sigma factor [Phycisphaerales bacterium]
MQRDDDHEIPDHGDAPTASDLIAGESALALTDAIVGGDRDAYARLFLARCDFVEREAARRLARRRDLAADVAQDAWIRVARGPRRCESIAKLDAWLQRVVFSAAIDTLRGELSRRAREERIASMRREAQEFVSDVELLESMRRELRGLGALSSDERSMLELRARTSATIGQLAAMLGVGRAAIDSRLRRASALARRHIEQDAVEGVSP